VTSRITLPYDWFLASVERHPDRLALDVAGVELTYTELRAAVEWMSARLYETLGRAPNRVGLLTTRTPVTYAAFLAAQRLGAAPVPLDPSASAQRNLDIAEEAELDVTVVDNSSGDGLTGYRQAVGTPVLDLAGDRWRGLLAPNPDDAVPPQVRKTGEDIAYVNFTGGSTGRPKGVPTTIRGMSAFVQHIIKRYRFTQDSRVAQAYELFTDGSIIERFGSWGSGASLHVPEQPDVLTPAWFVNRKRLTHWTTTPSMVAFARRQQALQPGSMPTLLHTSIAGEALTVENARAWAWAAPRSTVVNAYGPTETTVVMTGYVLPTALETMPRTSNGTVPIGAPYPHVEWVLLDDRLRPAADGELCVRGSQRFPGYLDPSQNTGRFILLETGRGRVYTGTEPLTPAHYYRTGDRCRLEHGELIYCGRMDDQLEIRGERVEPGEIEHALRRHPGIDDIVVIPVSAKATDGELDLHALYTGDEVPDADFAVLLRDLPRDFHPRTFQHRASLPLNPIGKINRTLLTRELAS
jgi:amino acid adenylation domain-containing protein